MNLIQSENLLIQFDWSPLINLFVLVFLLLFLNEIISWNLRRRLWLQQVIFIFKGLHKNLHHLYFSHNKIILTVYALMYDISFGWYEMYQWKYSFSFIDPFEYIVIVLISRLDIRVICWKRKWNSRGSYNGQIYGTIDLTR